MKILHLNASDVGSTGKIVLDICREANLRGYETVSLFPKRNRASSENIREYTTAFPLEQSICRRICYIYGLRYGLAPFATGRILRILRREKPDVVHLHSINCYFVNIYKLLGHLKKNGIPTVVTNHAEFFYTGNCAHAYDCEKWKGGCGDCPMLFEASDSKLFDRTNTAWKKMRKAFSGNNKFHVVSVSPWVYNRSIQSPVLENLTQNTVLNGVNTEIFKNMKMNSARKELGLNSKEKIILNVTANFSDLPNDIKGGRYLIDLARSFEGEKVRFIVVGKHSDIKDLPKNVTLIGQIFDQNLLALYYAAADLTAVVSRRETYGMTVAESLCCGTPVVGFKSGGSESIAVKEYTSFLSYGDVDALVDLIRDGWIEKKNDMTAKKISETAQEKYSAKVMAKKYCDLYESMVGEDN